MPPPSLPGPDPSLPLQSATGVLRTPVDDAAFEADFADLAARFAMQSGGSLSPELSAELALEIVLNEVVEQACLATGATGAAIVLQRDGEMVCRASSGTTAPELGARLDSASGISGECIRTGQTQRCDDVLADLRADLDASQRLGVRSVMVMPLLRGEELQGIFELFSSWPRAFGERDELTLQALAGRVLNNLNLSDRAVRNPPAADVESAKEISGSGGPGSAARLWPESLLTAGETRSESLTFREMENAALFSTPNSNVSSTQTPAVRSLDFTTAVLAAAVIVCVALLGLLLGRHVGAQQGGLRAPHAAAASKTPTSASKAKSSLGPGAVPSAQNATGAVSFSDGTDQGEIPAGSLLVYQNGREVFRQTPRTADAGLATIVPNASKENAMLAAMPSYGREEGKAAQEVQRAAALTPDRSHSLAQFPPSVVTSVDENDVLTRVEPDYPADARQQKIQGPVVLDVQITPAGRVQEMTLVTGQPLLVQAAKDAVQQWRFKPHSVGGHATAMQTRVTLNFRLP